MMARAAYMLLYFKKQKNDKLKLQLQLAALQSPITIIREITQAGTSTTRGNFGCIFGAIADCAT
jgi:hypothetical protein